MNNSLSCFASMISMIRITKKKNRSHSLSQRMTQFRLISEFLKRQVTKRHMSDIRGKNVCCSFLHHRRGFCANQIVSFEKKKKFLIAELQNKKGRLHQRISLVHSSHPIRTCFKMSHSKIIFLLK